MDGLMLDSECLYQAAWKTAAAELGYALDESLYLELVGRSNAEAEKAFVSIFGPDFPVNPFGDLWNQHWQTLVTSQGIMLKPGLLALLDWVEKVDLPKAVGTSSNAAETELCLTAAGIRDRFTTLVTVDQVRAGKPAPDIFLTAAEALQVAPDRCLVLEDSNAGVQAAHAAGMSVVMVPDLQVPDAKAQAIAHQIFPSLHEVLAWLQCF
jgi:beta-phosphoglucomutase-like phosphatase (HAD superfamily)